MQVYEEKGVSHKEAMKLVAKDRGISKRDVYHGIDLKKKKNIESWSEENVIY